MTEEAPDLARAWAVTGADRHADQMGWLTLDESLHQHFIVLNAVDHNLACQPTAVLEAQVPVEPSGIDIRSSHADHEFPISRVSSEGQGHVPQLTANAQGLHAGTTKVPT
jgi:hypothetical protein